MLTRRRMAAADALPDRAGLRAQVLGFLAAHERPDRWTYFCAGPPEGCARPPRPAPDIVLDIGGRIAYVAVARQGGGPLSRERAAALALARCRGAACFVVRSLPDMERALRALGIRLRCRGHLLAGGNAREEGGHGGGC